MVGDLSGDGAAADQDAEFHVEVHGVVGKVGAGDEGDSAVRHRTFGVQ